MKIALYGVSRSGKNYLIDCLLKHINEKAAKKLFHFNGSGTLDTLSCRLFSKPLKETSERQKNQLRLMLCDELASLKTEYQHIIVDAHYSFYKNSGYEVAFTDKDRDVYDMFFYLDTPANKIIEHANKDNPADKKRKNVAFLSESEIQKWKGFEIKELKKICFNRNKELIVLDNNIEDCIDYFETLLLDKKGIVLDAKKIAENMTAQYNDVIDQYDKIILLDCDRTISNNDTTYDFCNFLNIGKSELKHIFIGERYSLYQFFRAAKLYSQQDIDLYDKAGILAAEKAVLNEALIADIKNNGTDYLSIGITSGILKTWENIQARYEFPQIVVGGSNLKTDRFIVSTSVKYQLVKLLHNAGKYIIALGDSAIDIEMLEEADKGYIVAQEKLNNGIKEYVKGKKSNIMQLEYSPFHYDDLIIKRSIFS